MDGSVSDVEVAAEVLIPAGVIPHSRATPYRHSRAIVVALTISSLSFALLQTLVIPAVPVFASDLHTSTAWATWVTTSFLLVAAVTTPILGKLGDQFGSRRMLLVVLVVFFVSTIASVAARNIASLIVCRSFQGVSGAVLPLSFSLIRDTIPPERVAASIGFLSSMLGVGNGVAFLLGGWILDNFGWQTMFVVPAISVLLSIFLIRRYLPEPSHPSMRGRVDVRGASLLATTLVALLLALTQGPNSGWTSAWVLALAATSVAAFVLWVRVELNAPEPMIDVRTMRQRPLLLLSMIAIISNMANFATFILIPALAETPEHAPAAIRGSIHYGLHASATKAGFLLFPMAVTMLIAAPLAAQIGRALKSMKWPLAMGTGLVGLVDVAIVLWHQHIWQILIMTTIQGGGYGLIYSSLMTFSVEAVPASQTGVVTGLMTSLRSIGSQIGAQGSATILAAVVIAGTHVPREFGFQLAFLAAAFAAAVATVAALLVTPLRGSSRP